MSILDLFGVGDIHLEHRQATGAVSSQLLCPRALFIQDPSEHREAHLVQMFADLMAKPTVAACRESGEGGVSSNHRDRGSHVLRKASHALMICALQIGGPEEVFCLLR